jgi:hypothetical protein
MRDHAHALSDFRTPTLSIECEPCGRAGRYNVARLIERYGGMKLPELRHVLANCPKAKSFKLLERRHSGAHGRRLAASHRPPLAGDAGVNSNWWGCRRSILDTTGTRLCAKDLANVSKYQKELEKLLKFLERKEPFNYNTNYASVNKCLS